MVMLFLAGRSSFRRLDLHLKFVQELIVYVVFCTGLAAAMLDWSAISLQSGVLTIGSPAVHRFR